MRGDRDGRRVVVTGTGAVSALGAGAEALWQGLLANRSGVRHLPRFAAMGLPVTTGGEVEIAPAPGTDGGRAGGDGAGGGGAGGSGAGEGGAGNGESRRDCLLAGRAIGEALEQAGVAGADLASPGWGFIWAMGLDTFVLDGARVSLRTSGMGFAELAAPFGGPRRMIAVACASGTQALGEAFHLIRRGGAEACVAGGSSVMLTPFYLAGFGRLGAVALDLDGDEPGAACRPFDCRRRGLTLADGAGAVVLESADSARRRGARPLAEVLGFGTSQDAFDLNRPPEDGAGALLACQRALADAGADAAEVEAVNAHGTGTVAGDAAEAAALRRLLGRRWPATPVSAGKGATGHAMAAAGALEAIVACRTASTGLVPPTVNLERPAEDCALDHVIAAPRASGARRVLSLSLGMGGQNAALLLARPEA